MQNQTNQPNKPPSTINTDRLQHEEDNTVYTSGNTVIP